MSIPTQNINSIALQVELLLLATEEAPNTYYLHKFHGDLYLYEAVECYENDMVVNYIGNYSVTIIPRNSNNLFVIKQENKNEIFKLLKDYYLKSCLYHDWNQVKFLSFFVKN